MQENNLQKLQKNLVKQGLPFAFWSLPGSVEWEGIAQNDDRIDSVDINSEGFVVKSFDTKEKAGLIRSDFFFDKNNLNFKSDIKVKLDKSSSKNEIKEISKDEYIIKCNSLIEIINRGTVGKVVLSRVKKVAFDSNLADLFLRLIKAYPQAMVFLYHFDNKLWIGATPETLLKVEGNDFFTMALAGSRKLGEISEWPEKERDEQAYVENYIKSQLSKYANKFESEGPMTIKAGPIEHLCTKFTGRIAETKALELINALHPTPAVCGIPLRSAIDIISELEIHDRLDYTGYLGPISKIKKHVFVNLRSALVEEGELCLFLGGGITKDSISEKEWEETELKAKTLLKVL